MITTILSNLGLKDEEIKTYLLILELGAISAGTLAKKLGIPRATLYDQLQLLQEKGLINQSLDIKGVKIFAAESPEKIALLLKQRKEQIEQDQALFHDLLPALQTQRASKFLKPKFQVYEGAEELKHLLKDMLLYSNMETQAYWPIKPMVDILSPDFFRYHNKERIKNNLSVRAIWPENEVVDVAQHPYLGVGEAFLREIRVAPSDIDFTMGYWIYGNKVAFISSRKESFGFIVESTELVEMLLSQFEILWKISKTLEVDGKATQPFINELDTSNSKALEALY